MPITDSFTNADNTALTTHSASWGLTRAQGATFEIFSNQVRGAGGGFQESAAQRLGTFPAAHYSQLVQANSSAGDIGPAVRCGGVGSNAYYGWYSNTVSSYLFSMNGADGTWTQIGSSAAAFAVSDVVRLDVNGTTLTPTRNGSTSGTPGVQTNSLHASGAPGITRWNGSTAARAMDDFESTDLSSGGGDTWNPRFRRGSFGQDARLRRRRLLREDRFAA